MLLAARRVTEYHPSHRAEDAFAEADSLRSVWAIESALAKKNGGDYVCKKQKSRNRLKTTRNPDD